MDSRKPFEIPEVILHIGRFLDAADLDSAVQISTLWNRVLQPILQSRTVCWKDTLSEAERGTALQQILHGNIRSLECDLAYFKGKSLWYLPKRDIQKEAYEPVKMALMNEDPESQLHKWVVRGSNFVEDDFFVVLLELKALRHFWIDTLPGRESKPHLSKLFKILGRPSLQTLRRLTVVNGYWSNMGFPFPNTVKCQLRKIVLENTPLTEANLTRLLESCPFLEELVAVGVMNNWNLSIFKSISNTNPSLNALTFSCSSSCGDIQLGSLTKYLTVDLKTLGLYHLQCSADIFAQLLIRFKDLTRLEIHGESNESCGALVHHYLSTCASARHLVAKNVCIPMRLLEDKGNLSWICKDLVTLDISFGDLDSMESQEDQVAAESRLLFEYLVTHIPNVRNLSIRKHKLSVKEGDGVEQLKGLIKLEQLSIGGVN
ncbi:hypothetical protein B0O80DRAFT_473014 [Mortierella sp. GBAus27b]|nr:hypothetical protein BGX31_005863 [Mortierella sp. GBA43]KAI8345467.1 hypothetical protein B0O80DRAFT_473014 [Mortierella sp. GBAus27b]